MASGLVLTVAAHGKILPDGERSQQGDQPLRRRLSHLSLVATGEGGPPPGRERFRVYPGEQGRGRRELRKPNIEVILWSEILLAHSPGRTAHGAETEAFIDLARRTEADGVDGQGHDPRQVGMVSAFADQGAEALGCDQEVRIAQQVS